MIQLLKKIKPYWNAILLSIVGLLSFVIVFNYNEGISSYGAYIFLASVGISIFSLMDNVSWSGFNTGEELKKGNIAVAIAICGLFVFLGLSAIACFSVFPR